MNRILAIFLCIMFMYSTAFATSAGQLTYEVAAKVKKGPTGGPATIHKWTMVSSSEGSVYDTDETAALSGKLKIYWVDHDGTVTDNFDIYLYSSDTDKDGKDWLYGSCENLSSTNSSTSNYGLPLNLQGGFVEVPAGNYYTSGSGFGDAKTVYIYLQEE